MNVTLKPLRHSALQTLLNARVIRNVGRLVLQLNLSLVKFLQLLQVGLRG